MTTALIGKQDRVGLRARVALVSKGRVKDVAALLTRAGHEVLELDDWSGIAGEAAALDLVLFDEEQAPAAPRGLPVPAVQIGERMPNASGNGFGCVAVNAIEAALEPLLNMALELRQSVARCRELEQLVEGVRTGSAMVGRSPVVRRLHGTLSRAADSDATILIEGPRGAGKSLAARIIHCKSRRSSHALEVFECADLDADSIAKALQAARGTSLLLESIERLPTAAQAVLVRHLKEKSGPNQAGAARILVTTSAHLPELVAKGAFREDLYYRLHTFPIVVPALRERIEDVSLIAAAILDVASVGAAKSHQGITPGALAMLESMNWSGNVTQLEATVRRAHALAAGAAVDREHVSAPSPLAPAVGSPVAAPVGEQAEQEIDENAVRPFEEEEQMLLSRALRATKGNVRRAAQLLGIGRATLYRKIQQYKLRLQ